MKIILYSILIALVFAITCKAESDTLVIKLKNNQIEKIAVSQIQKIQFENITGVEEQLKIPIGLAVKGNYPNPFTDQTSIEFEIASSGNVLILIYDNSGNHIQSLKCENCIEGKNTLQWDCKDSKGSRVQSGVYFYEVRFNNEVQSKKMILIK